VILPPIPLYSSLGASAALCALLAGFTRVFFPSSARTRVARAGAFVLAAVVLGAHAAWAVGMRHYPTSAFGATTATVLLPCLTLVAASIPVAAVARALLSRALLRAPAVPETASPEPKVAVVVGRRQVVQAAAAAVPLAAAATGVAGFAGDACITPVRRVVFGYPDLPPALDGLRILQLSDLHLGCTKGLGDLERLLATFAAKPPDLLVVTGDIAEDVRLLAPALRLIADVRPRLGAYASLGNHEYLRDIDATRPILERSPVPLLVSAGHTIKTGGARIHLAGADDPVFLRGDLTGFFERSVDAATDGAPSDAFHILLSHRPEGFDVAARRALHLTLSGHTHGGQIGFHGKSAFEPLYPDGYLWGAYARGGSRLYTTSGFGDWYPFRLGCPTESALLVLERQRA
jgi:predicted MPP superfamily phosphohydrolase